MNRDVRVTVVWHPASEFKPGNSRDVLLCFKGGKVDSGFFMPDGSARFNQFFAQRAQDVEYWADFPKGPPTAPSGNGSQEKQP